MSLKNSINKLLRKFGVELHGLGYLRALSKGEFNTDELTVMKKIFKNQNILIYDIGANRGLMTKRFIDQFPSASIHLFEPYTPFYDALISEFKENNNIKVNCQGIADKEGEQVFNINKSIDTSSFLDSQATGLNSDQQVQTISQVNVPVITVDKYAELYSHKRINVLKLDIQGSELNALNGAKDLLRERKIDLIFCETYFVQQYVHQPLFFDIANFLIKYGYVIQDIYHPIYGKGKLAWCDTLFVRNDLIIE
jgi:FkbM family methyltransferase